MRLPKSKKFAAATGVLARHNDTVRKLQTNGALPTAYREVARSAFSKRIQ